MEMDLAVRGRETGLMKRSIRDLKLAPCFSDALQVRQVWDHGAYRFPQCLMRTQPGLVETARRENAFGEGDYDVHFRFHLAGHGGLATHHNRQPGAFQIFQRDGRRTGTVDLVQGNPGRLVAIKGAIIDVGDPIGAPDQLHQEGRLVLARPDE